MISRLSTPSKNDCVAHIFATIWVIYWQYTGRTAHLSAVYGQYVAAPVPYT